MVSLSVPGPALTSIPSAPRASAPAGLDDLPPDVHGPPASARVSIATRAREPSVTHIVARTDRGRTRSENQDSFLIDRALGLAVVCDGMGGHAAGDLASALAVRAFGSALAEQQGLLARYLEGPSAFEAIGKRDIMQLMQDAANAASRAVYETAAEDPDKAGMGTTLVAALVLGDHAFIVNVGDSRAYLLRNGDLEQVTRDHSAYNELVWRKKLHPDEAYRLAPKNALTRAVGVSELCEPDTFVFEVTRGDRLLLCTDGLYRYFEPPEGAGEHLRLELLEPDDQKLGDTLVDIANARGGGDNITAVVMTLGSLGDYDHGRLSAMAARREALAASALFSLLDARELSRVLAATYVQRFAAGDTIIDEEAIGGDLYLVLRGAVSVYQSGVPIAELETGDHFGEMSLLRGGRRSAGALAARDTEVLLLPRHELLGLIRDDRELGMKLLWQFVGVLTDRLAATTQALRRSAVVRPLKL